MVKIGGATLGSQDTTIEDLVYLQRQGKSLVVVHGGGKLITEWLTRQGISSRFVQGERVSDAATLEVVVSVLAGLVNKKIVAAINDRGGRAVGISGVDGSFLQGRIKDIKLGYVGAIVRIDTTLLEMLVASGYMPVVAPIGLLSFDESNEAIRMLNINADTVAGEIAAVVGAEKIIFLTDVVGVCDHSGKFLPKLSPNEAEALIASGVASGGMIPKIKACLSALASTATTHILDGRQPHSLLREIEKGGSGTTIQAID